MPPMPLTDTAVRNAKPADKTTRLYDEKGLYLEVSPKGGKWWRFKYRFDGKEKRLSFGVYPDVSLKEARNRRDDARKLVANYIDPGEQRKAQKRVNALKYNIIPSYRRGIKRIAEALEEEERGTLFQIKRLRDKGLPVVASYGGLAASGGYYIAAAADEIYADKASIVGSIGVRMDGFGFVETIEKLGIERRLLTAGEHKGFLDPFQPVKQEDVAQVKKLLDDIHQQFINVVRQGRGDKLKDDPLLFSGYVWTGEQGIDLGLVDELGSSSYVAREVIGAETIVDYTPSEDWLEKVSKHLGTALGRGFGEVLGGGSLIH